MQDPAIHDKPQDASALHSLAPLFRSTPDDFWYWCLAEGIHSESWLAGRLPKMPSPSIQEKFTGRSGHATMEQAFGFYQICKQQLGQLGLTMEPDSRVLDFGCGWGRITRFFLKDVHPHNLHGVDSMPEAIQICRDLNLPCQITPISPFPPIFFHDDSLDFIMAYSVFSHLSEECASAWMKEFHRILKPGGVVIATTRPREVIMEFERMRQARQFSDFNRVSLALFQDVEGTLKAYDEGRFVFEPAIPLVEPRGFFGEALIPAAYVQKHYARIFSEARLIPVLDHNRFDQNLMILRKRAGRSTGTPESSDDLTSRLTRGETRLHNPDTPSAQIQNLEALIRIFTEWMASRKNRQTAIAESQTEAGTAQSPELLRQRLNHVEQLCAMFEKRLSEAKQKVIDIRQASYCRTPVTFVLKHALLKKLTRFIVILETFCSQRKARGLRSVFRYPLRALLFLRGRWQSRKSLVRLIENSGFFDTQYYLEKNPEVAKFGLDPIKHYLRYGAYENRFPNPFFDTAFYLSSNPDVQESGMNPLVHFIVFGVAEERDPGPGFNTRYYIKSNPDVGLSDTLPFVHFFFTGQQEGRPPVPRP